MTTATATRTYAIIRTNIIGSRDQVFSAWVKDDSCRGFSTIRHIGDDNYGRLGTEALPPEIDRLPKFSAERSEAYHEWRQATYAVAYDLIRRAFLEPEGIDGGSYDMGEVRWEAAIKGRETRFVEA